jgi:signal transduction histidine kinase
MEGSMTGNIYFILITGSLAMAVLAGIVIVSVVLYQKRQIKHQHELQQTQLKHQLELLQNSIEIQEQERKRFAADLHDEAGAILSAVKLNLHQLADSNHVTMVAETRQMLDTAIQSIRRVSHDLSPPVLEQFGFQQAVTDLFIRFNALKSINFTCDMDGITHLHFSKQVEISLYRIISELLNNTIKHSGATEASLKMEKLEHEVILTYMDNGKGVDQHGGQKTKGSGMKNIETRITAFHGRIVPGTATGHGFNLQINFPYKEI